jgi:spore coat protein A, manganese oxidase
MSNKKSIESVESIESKSKFGRIFPIGIVALLAIGVFGAISSTLKSPESNVQSPKSHTESTTQNSTTSQPISPTTATVTSATPQLSKEMIYAGSRLLAVEDANANATPPADLAVWRSSNGTFYVLGGPGSTQTFFQWGMAGDIPAPGDYDGDGKTDFSIVRPSTSGGSGVWWIFYSSTLTYNSISFGLICPPPTTCDKVAQADYDGDGKTDPAVFRSSDHMWYILPSGGGSFYGVPYGEATDIPAPADYDGDGKADIAVWRNSNTTFYSNNSSNGATQYINIGQSADKPVSGDYDGDGRADYAIKSGNIWRIRSSSTGLMLDPVTWQDAGDIAVQNDYDGDGKVDIATWKPAGGVWQILKSSNGQTRTEYWGIAEDIPVPAYYRR